MSLSQRVYARCKRTGHGVLPGLSLTKFRDSPRPHAAASAEEPMRGGKNVIASPSPTGFCIRDGWPCQLAVFSGKLPSMGGRNRRQIAA